MAKPSENGVSSVSQASSASHEHVKRPMNAFMVWAKTERRRLAMRLPGMPNSEVSKILGDLWKQLPESEKSRFRSESESIRKQHRSDHPDYRYHPRRRVGKVSDAVKQAKGSAGSKSKSQKSRAQRQSFANAMSFYSQHSGAELQHCMPRQIPECYFGWPMAQSQLPPGTNAGAAAGYCQTAVGHAQSAMSAPSRPPSISFDSSFSQPRQGDVTAPAVSTTAANGQCGWPMKLGDNAADQWSTKGGALAAPVWHAPDDNGMAGAECLSDVGTPPALVHSAIGESPHSNGCVSLRSPVSPLTRVGSPGSVLDSSTGPYQKNAAVNARRGVVPSGEDDLVGYMQLYLGDSQKDPVPTNNCKLGDLLTSEGQPSVRSVSPPFSVPSARTTSSRDVSAVTPVTTSSTYEYNSLGLSSNYAPRERSHPASVLAGPTSSYGGDQLSWDQPVAAVPGQNLTPVTGSQLPCPQYAASQHQQPCVYGNPLANRLVSPYPHHIAV